MKNSYTQFVNIIAKLDLAFAVAVHLNLVYSILNVIVEVHLNHVSRTRNVVVVVVVHLNYVSRTRNGVVVVVVHLNYVSRTRNVVVVVAVVVAVVVVVVVVVHLNYVSRTRNVVVVVVVVVHINVTRLIRSLLQDVEEEVQLEKLYHFLRT